MTCKTPVVGDSYCVKSSSLPFGLVRLFRSKLAKAVALLFVPQRSPNIRLICWAFVFLVLDHAATNVRKLNWAILGDAGRDALYRFVRTSLKLNSRLRQLSLLLSCVL
jgi:hypothetical protein